MHVAKSGGTSVHDALLAALPPGSISANRGDATVTCTGTAALADLVPSERLAAWRAEWSLDGVSQSEVVSGHFYLPTLLEIVPPGSISTVLREPRTRMLSLYMFWRLTPGYERWYPLTPHEHAMRPLDEFLAESLMAPAVDNVVCRLLLHGDSRVPVEDFMSPEHVEGVAADAVDRIGQLGFVGVLELARGMWEGLSRFFGVSLKPSRANVTASTGVIPEALPFHSRYPSGLSTSSMLGLLETLSCTGTRLVRTSATLRPSGSVTSASLLSCFA